MPPKNIRGSKRANQDEISAFFTPNWKKSCIRLKIRFFCTLVFFRIKIVLLLKSLGTADLDLKYTFLKLKLESHQKLKYEAE